MQRTYSLIIPKNGFINELVYLSVIILVILLNQQVKAL